MSVVAIKTADLTQNFKQIADSIIMNGEKVLISRPRNENLVLITESEYNALDKARQNVEYLAKLDMAMENQHGKNINHMNNITCNNKKACYLKILDMYKRYGLNKEVFSSKCIGLLGTDSDCIRASCDDYNENLDRLLSDCLYVEEGPALQSVEDVKLAWEEVNRIVGEIEKDLGINSD